MRALDVLLLGDAVFTIPSAAVMRSSVTASSSSGASARNRSSIVSIDAAELGAIQHRQRQLARERPASGHRALLGKPVDGRTVNAVSPRD